MHRVYTRLRYLINRRTASTTAAATYTVNPASPIQLAVDTNTVIITVTARDQSTVKEYTLKIVRKRSDDIALKEILINSSISLPVSTPDLISYYYSVENDVTQISVTAMVNHSGASYQINPSSPITTDALKNRY
jgi:hypothetical protein